MYDRIRKTLSIVALSLALAACGTTSQTPAAAPAGSQPTAAPAAAAPAGGARTFRIVPDQTEASYEVQEQFLRRDLPNMAIGKTNTVEGEFQFSLDGQPTGQVTKFTVDLRTLTSDETRRDNRIRRQWLESEKYPTATFVSTEAQNLPSSYTEGQEVSFKLVGNLTIREITKPVTFDVTGKLVGDTVTGTASAQILMKDFGFDPPNIAGMLTVKDGVTIRVNFTAKEAQ
jgi:polyisoprenoid-binding protein YceI